ncbi:MAG: hypothetical protein AAGF02_20670, partial [Actinomycetota bacterium]
GDDVPQPGEDADIPTELIDPIDIGQPIEAITTASFETGDDVPQPGEDADIPTELIDPIDIADPSEGTEIVELVPDEVPPPELTDVEGDVIE